MIYVLKSSGNREVKHLPILGHGHQGTVFKNGDHATKVFNLHNIRPTDSDGKVTIRISSLNLEAFVRPYNLNFKDGKLVSFDMDLLHLEKDKKIVDMDIEDVLDSLSIIREDAKTLSENGILIRDLQRHNIGVSKDRIKVYDFSDYEISSVENLKKINDGEIDALFGSMCIMLEMPEIDTIDVYDHIYSDYLRSGFSTIEEYFKENILGKFDNIRSYVNYKCNSNVRRKSR